MAHASQRPPAVAGLFYPADPHSLHAQISNLLAGAVPAEIVDSPKALVVPHAGYIYSGAVAATAYEPLAHRRGILRRIVILCPTHRVPVRGNDEVAKVATAFNLTPEQYRVKWGLDPSYPMVAPNYAEKRSTLAKQIGLGTRRAAE